MRDRKNQRGFALIEALLALAIVGLSMTAAAAFFNSVSKTREAARTKLRFISDSAAASDIFYKSIEKIDAREGGGLSGFSDRLQFSGRPPIGSNQDELITYFFHADKRQNIFYLSMINSKGTRETHELQKGVAVRFSFAGAPVGSKSLAPHETWAANLPLPRAVNMKLSSLDGSSQTLEYTIQIRIAAP